ncbi:nuclear transport factor 2 family protein [Streptomyces phytophilus]|uniref:nuclear transport factor 2 family protein n=1 Tax=Streptomyces phytophilus TaxID=722715 RepID=UPI0015EFFFDB|nr:nuclear transport factor 2 family protein [Streptomyces phytophilus]
MTNDDATDSLRTAERRLQAAQLASDTGTLDELLDGAGRFTGPDGKLYTKDDDLRSHETGHQVLTSLKEEDLRVLATGDTGVTWFLGTLEGSVGGQPLRARLRYTRAWHRGGAGWRIIAAHATFVGEESPGTGDGPRGG